MRTTADILILLSVNLIGVKRSTEAVCDTGPVADENKDQGHGPSVRFGVSNIHLQFVFVHTPVSDFNSGYDLCNSLLKSSDLVEYARLAVFETPGLYSYVMSQIGGSTNVIIGAHNNWLGGTNLGEWYWVTDRISSQMCYIFDTTDGKHQPQAADIPSGYTLDPIGDGYATPPYVWTASPSDPFRIVPRSNTAINLPIICEYGCGPTNYSMTPAWITDAPDPKTTTNSATSSVTTPIVTSTTSSSGKASSSATSPLTGSTDSVLYCTKSYSKTSSCISETPIESHPGAAEPQDCANLCSLNTRCRSFSFRLGDATCTGNTCDLFDLFSTEGTSGGGSDCFHYDTVV